MGSFDITPPDIQQSEGLYFQMAISGRVSDLETGEGLPYMKIVVETYQNDNEAYPPKTAYTNDQGDFTVRFDGYKRPTSVIATAIDSDSLYIPDRREILISWNDKYNIHDGVYRLNGCDFYMKKK